jgi:hypothetical protein
MGKSYVRIIQALALAAAVLGLLLTTPSIEARTASKHASKSSHKKTSKSKPKKKPTRKKMKIVFDGSAPTASDGELGDEIVQPRASDRQFSDSRAVVRLRGGSVDDLWKKSKEKTISRDDEENPDLIEPVSYGEADAPASKRSKKPTTIALGDSVDESALASFKTSSKTSPASKSHAKPKVTAVATASNQTRPPVIEDTLPELDFDDVKPVPHKSLQIVEAQPTRVRPLSAAKAEPATASQSKIYLRNVQPVARSSTRLTSETPSEFKFNFAFENTTSMGRKYELETPGGRNYMMKNEVFLGIGHSSGWGAKVAANYIATSNDDATKDIREMGDPSIIVSHPSIYKSIDIDIYGQGRYYLPVAQDSRQKGLQHFAYYLLTDVQLIEGLTLHNEFVPRYYLQAQYADSDAFGLIYDHTEVSKRFDFFRIGLGQRTQIESHQAISPGTSVEIYPFADLLAISNTVIQAKLYIPLVATGVVNGAPGSPSGPSGSGLSNLQAEFFARLSF